LPIGGVKQKVMAAHRAGLTTIILPRRNEADLDDVPEDIRQEMTFHLAETIDEVLEYALSSSIPFGDALGDAVDAMPAVELTLN
jgi:ATP-dependent Lon protease